MEDDIRPVEISGVDAFAPAPQPPIPDAPGSASDQFGVEVHPASDYLPDQEAMGFLDKVRLLAYIHSLYSQFKEHGMTQDLKSTLIGLVGGLLTWTGDYFASGQQLTLRGFTGGISVFALGWISNKLKK
jgi:hypothetical protein